MRSQHTPGGISLRTGRKITDMVLMAWLGVEQLGTFISNSLVMSCGKTTERGTRNDAWGWKQ